jgi:hypothetical protein
VDPTINAGYSRGVEPDAIPHDLNPIGNGRFRKMGFLPPITVFLVIRLIWQLNPLSLMIWRSQSCSCLLKTARCGLIRVARMAAGIQALPGQGLILPRLVKPWDVSPVRPGWLLSAPGGVVYSDHGAVIQDLEGDGIWQTGWSILYMHIDPQNRVEWVLIWNQGTGWDIPPVRAVFQLGRTCILPGGIMENGSQRMGIYRL